jgi:hypothetical protein
MILFPLGIEPGRSFAMRALAFTVGILMTIGPTSRAGSSVDDEKAVAALDTEYQAAVKKIERGRWLLKGGQKSLSSFAPSRPPVSARCLDQAFCRL